MKISLQNLTKDFGSGPVLDDISLEIEDREFFFLLGPSGCGKTTLLRLLAGFYPPDQGEVYFDDILVNDLPAHERNTGMVFQNYALWPHMNVLQNVGYGLDVRKTDHAERDRRVKDALNLVQMEDYGHRFPNELSGGQQQRVALARALVIKPKVLLFDEPLSNLDARLRLELREEIRALQAQTRITTIYVTHDHSEALSMANRIALLNRGRIEQLGPPRTIYQRPASRFVADFVGETNWWKGTVTEVEGQTARVKTALGEWIAIPGAELSSGSAVWVGCRPEQVSVEGQGVNQFEGQLQSVNFLGEREEYQFTMADGSPLKAYISRAEQTPSIGSRLTVGIRPESVMVLRQ